MMRSKKSRRKNILKLISVVFSFFLWFYIVSSTSVEIEKKVRVEYLLPDGLVIDNSVPSFVHYKLSGPRVIMDNLVSTEQSIVINLKQSKKNKKKFSISYLNYPLKFPFSVKVMSVHPKRIDVNLVRAQSKIVKLAYKMTNTLERAVELENLILSTKKVKVIGAKRVLAQIDELYTEPVDLSQINRSKIIKLKIINEDLRVKIEPEHITAKVKLKSALKEVVLKKVPILLVSDKPVLSREHSTVRLVVNADKELSEGEISKGVTVSAKAVGLKSGKHQVSLDINLPLGVTLIKSSLNKLNIEIGKTNE